MYKNFPTHHWLFFFSFGLLARGRKQVCFKVKFVISGFYRTQILVCSPYVVVLLFVAQQAWQVRGRAKQWFKSVQDFLWPSCLMDSVRPVNLNLRPLWQFCPIKEKLSMQGFNLKKKREMLCDNHICYLYDMGKVLYISNICFFWVLFTCCC